MPAHRQYPQHRPPLPEQPTFEVVLSDGTLPRTITVQAPSAASALRHAGAVLDEGERIIAVTQIRSPLRPVIARLDLPPEPADRGGRPRKGADPAALPDTSTRWPDDKHARKPGTCAPHDDPKVWHRPKGRLITVDDIPSRILTDAQQRRSAPPPPD